MKLGVVDRVYPFGINGGEFLAHCPEASRPFFYAFPKLLRLVRGQLVELQREMAVAAPPKSGLVTKEFLQVYFEDVPCPSLFYFNRHPHVDSSIFDRFAHIRAEIVAFKQKKMREKVSFLVCRRCKTLTPITADDSVEVPNIKHIRCEAPVKFRANEGNVRKFLKLPEAERPRCGAYQMTKVDGKSIFSHCMQLEVGLVGCSNLQVTRFWVEAEGPFEEEIGLGRTVHIYGHFVPRFHSSNRSALSVGGMAFIGNWIKAENRLLALPGPTGATPKQPGDTLEVDLKVRRGVVEYLFGRFGLPNHIGLAVLLVLLHSFRTDRSQDSRGLNLLLFGDPKTGKTTLLRSLSAIFPRAPYCRLNSMAENCFPESTDYTDKLALIESTPFDNAHLGVLLLDDLQSLSKDLQPRLVSRMKGFQTFDFSGNLPTLLQLNVIAVLTNTDGKKSKRPSDAVISMSGAPDGIERQFPLVFALPSQTQWEEMVLDFQIQQEHESKEAGDGLASSRRRGSLAIPVPGLLAFVHRRVGLSVTISSRLQSILKCYSQRVASKRTAEELQDPYAPLEIMTKAHAAIFSRGDATVFDAMSAVFLFDLSRGKQFKWLTPAFCNEISPSQMQAESLRALRELGLQQ